MRGNHLIFSRSGDRRRLYDVSPLLYPQYTVLNDYFLPSEHELPQHGLKAQVLVFDFGFSNPSLIVAPMDSQFFPFTLPNSFLAAAITGVSDIAPSSGVVPAPGLLAGVAVSPAYLVNIQQTHKGNTWQWANKDVTNVEAHGTASNPLLFKSPPLIPAGDTVSCVVRNLGNSQLRVQIALIGGGGSF